MKKVNLLVNISLIDIKINLFVSDIVKLFKNINQKNHLYNEYLTHIKKINQDNVDLFLAYFYAQVLLILVSNLVLINVELVFLIRI
ncbi:hypothetical protein NW066_04675 [Mycoplasmopsis felis]|uniref:hypothetical protein n=1 Tax=Mycoplasmopsis felis TaxID=33923 RepID=UPI0021AF3A7D|nr:hypothetical protein [Mycoplasmopsis felis]UWV84848.1 hypothetical protein NW066_04675 [Mycoplasmopsis felis]